MEEHELPTWNGIIENAVGELDKARSALSEAASWLRSDWRPLGSPLPDGAGDARTEVTALIGQMKATIDRAKDTIDDARR